MSETPVSPRNFPDVDPELFDRAHEQAIRSDKARERKEFEEIRLRHDRHMDLNETARAAANNDIQSHIDSAGINFDREVALTGRLLEEAGLEAPSQEKTPKSVPPAQAA